MLLHLYCMSVHSQIAETLDPIQPYREDSCINQHDAFCGIRKRQPGKDSPCWSLQTQYRTATMMDPFSGFCLPVVFVDEYLIVPGVMKFTQLFN